jgi:hypothetical protein
LGAKKSSDYQNVFFPKPPRNSSLLGTSTKFGNYNKFGCVGNLKESKTILKLAPETIFSIWGLYQKHIFGNFQL